MAGYAVKEIYYTLQGEGANAGRPAVFVRFSGCNLWSGRAADRGRGADCSAWCDTDFVGTDGPAGGRYTAAGLVAAARRLWPAAWVRPFAVCTGGEPLLQLDAPLLGELHAAGFEVAVETNGTRPVPAGVDWVCVSPKGGSDLVVRAGDELKLAFPQAGLDPERLAELDFRHHFLQPIDGPAQAEHTRAAVAYCLAHPQWRLSVQTHKWLGLA